MKKGLDTNFTSVSEIRFPEISKKFIVLFAGSMGRAQGLDTVLECAGLCREEMPNVKFIFIGGGVEKFHLQNHAKEMGLDNVSFLPPRSMEKMQEIFALADTLLVHLKDDPLYRVTIPSKTQAYLYIGKPIIMAMCGDAATLVRNADAGIICSPENPQEMINAIKTLYDMSEIERLKIGESGRSFYLKHLSFKTGVEKFENLFIA